MPAAYINFRDAHFRLRQDTLAAGTMMPAPTSTQNDIFHVVELKDRFVFIVQPPGDTDGNCSIGEFFKGDRKRTDYTLPTNLTRIEALNALAHHVTNVAR